MSAHLSIQARARLDDEWLHVNSVPAWAMDDPGMARIQRAHARTVYREWHGLGTGTHILLRLVDEDGQVAS